MSKEITAYQRLTLDDAIDVTELHAVAILGGSKPIARIHMGRDYDAFMGLMKADEQDEFRVYSHDFFKVADASVHQWQYENSMIRFMSAIKDYFNKSGADVVYIHFR